MATQATTADFKARYPADQYKRDFGETTDAQIGGALVVAFAVVDELVPGFDGDVLHEAAQIEYAAHILAKEPEDVAQSEGSLSLSPAGAGAPNPLNSTQYGRRYLAVIGPRRRPRHPKGLGMAAP